MAMNIENGVRWLGIEAPASTGQAGAPGLAKPEPAGQNFGDELGKAIGALDRMQTEADAQVHEVALGGGNLHEMAIALEKADIGMRLATKVRNKVVEAYQEIMKTGV